MRISTTTLSVILLLAGCSPTGVWVPPQTIPMKQADLEAYNCKAQAYGAGGYSTITLPLQTASGTLPMFMSRPTMNKTLYRECMQAHGWMYSTKPAAVAYMKRFANPDAELNEASLTAIGEVRLSCLALFGFLNDFPNKEAWIAWLNEGQNVLEMFLIGVSV